MMLDPVAHRPAFGPQAARMIVHVEAMSPRSRTSPKYTAKCLVQACLLVEMATDRIRRGAMRPCRTDIEDYWRPLIACTRSTLNGDHSPGPGMRGPWFEPEEYAGTSLDNPAAALHLLELAYGVACRPVYAVLELRQALANHSTKARARSLKALAQLEGAIDEFKAALDK